MNHSHETVPTQYVNAEGIRHAYRRFGKSGGVPLLFLEYFNSNMDGWDPLVTNSLAADQEVILFNNAGVASSGGNTPATVPEMAEHCVAFCHALGLGAINVVGFSLGGMIAQQLALDHPRLVKRIILLGTGPRGGEGMTFTELSAEEQADPVAFLLGGFFSPSKASQAAGREHLKRLESRKEDRDLPVSRDSAVAQLAAIREWGAIPTTGRYATLKEITHPTLIVHGNKDVVVSPINAFILAEQLPNAQLIVYPDSSHGAQYQHARLFLEHAKLFLSEAGSTAPALERVSISTSVGASRGSDLQNKNLVLEAFDTLFNRRDYAAAETFWSPTYIQHSAHIAPGREGLFELVKAAPPTLKYEAGLVTTNGDYVILHGRFSGLGLPRNWIVADILRIEDGILVEHWDVIQDEATEEQSKSKAPMFGDSFAEPARQAAPATTDSPLTIQRARAIVAPIYDALNEPAKKDVNALLAQAANPDYKSHSTNEEWLTRDQLADVFKMLGSVIPDLHWTIKDIQTVDDQIIVRGEATGTPTGPLFGAKPTGKSFKTMAIDIFTVKSGKLASAYHVENWMTALQQISK